MVYKWVGGLLLLSWMAVAFAGCADPADKLTVHALDSVVKQGEQLKQLDSASEQLYEKLEQGHILEAKQELDGIKNMVTSGLNFKGVTTAEGVNELIQTVMEADKAFTRVKFSYGEGMQSAAKLRLAADALTHPQQPMWLQYDRIMMQDTERLDAAVNSRQLDAVRSVLSTMKSHYARIRPAIVISRGLSPAVRTDSLFSYMDSILKSSPPDMDLLQSGAAHFKQLWKELFRDPGHVTNVPVPIGTHPPAWPAVLLSVIAVILAYVGWVKYKNRQDYVVVRKQTGAD